MSSFHTVIYASKKIKQGNVERVVRSWSESSERASLRNHRVNRLHRSQCSEDLGEEHSRQTNYKCRSLWGKKKMRCDWNPVSETRLKRKAKCLWDRKTRVMFFGGRESNSESLMMFHNVELRKQWLIEKAGLCWATDKGSISIKE